MVELRTLLGTGDLHDEAEEDLRVVPELLGNLRCHVGELGALATAVEDGLAAFALGLGHLVRALHALGEQVADLGVDRVYAGADLCEVGHGAPNGIRGDAC